MSPEPVEAVLALGANLGDRAATLRAAVLELAAADGVDVVAVSDVVETDPVGGPEQPDYLNAVVVVRTTIPPRALLAVGQLVEQRHGRERQIRWGARTLDVDVLAFGPPDDPGEVVSDDADLTLPHPRAHERAFVLVPWAQVQPDARLRMPDGSVRGVADLAAAAPDHEGVRRAAVGALR